MCQQKPEVLCVCGGVDAKLLNGEGGSEAEAPGSPSARLAYAQGTRMAQAPPHSGPLCNGTPHPLHVTPPRDISEGELRRLLGHMAPWPLLLLQSGADECVVDTSTIPEMGRRVMRAVAAGHSSGRGPSAQPGCVVERRHVVIEGASHNATGFEAELAQHVEEFLSCLPV